ncbi:hypothetical protein NQ318_001470 [Aromia moschata]|uniref:Sodium/potassium-transporting ATPase subunit beta-2 n=1 Tax=Aromia moschata TaxID=1265417 RepID=A0AAV8YWA4_9CUCU|nr:hypothetical protein NQ318_001470 [Aromia moschata]
MFNVSGSQLLLFYTIFYIVLGLLFFVCMRVLFTTLDKQEPTWTMERSLIGVNPGLGFRPMPADTAEGSLIWYNIANDTSIEKWVKLIDDFLEPYRSNQTGHNYANCDFAKNPARGEVCVNTLQDLGNCNAARKYGYNTNAPCIFLKLNRIYGWMPEFYTASEPGMPQDLQMHINNTPPERRDQIWVSCNGVDNVDKEFISSFTYYPHGFAGYYYPFRNDPHYLSPIVAVEVRLKTTNVIVNVECRAWARNIQYQGGSLNREGSVTFEIQIDTSETSKL